MHHSVLLYMLFNYSNGLVFSEDEDSDWPLSQNPTNSIGQSNGDHDLARTVLEVGLGI